MNENEKEVDSVVGISMLYFFAFIYIIVIFYTQKSNPMAFSIYEYVGLLILMIIELSVGFTMTTNYLNLFFAVFITWILLFLPIVAIYSNKLKGYVDEFNSIFSNVIGYLFVANDSSKILSKLNLGDQPTDSTLIDTYRVVAYIRKSYSLYINQLTPSNFDFLWDSVFKQLFINTKSPNDTELNEIRSDLLNITNTKFIVGKCIWYFYICGLAISLSSFFITL